MMTEDIWQATHQQQIFHLLMRSMAYPGRCHELAASTDENRHKSVLAALLDPTVGLCDHHKLLSPDDLHLLAARQDSVGNADFVLVEGARAPDFKPRIGTLSEPELSTTLLICVTDLGSGDTKLNLTGPGIKNRQELRLNGLHADWIEWRSEQVASFPLGVDIILIDEQRVAALPRTTLLELH